MKYFIAAATLAAGLAFGASGAAAEELYGTIVSTNPQGITQTSITPGMANKEACEQHNKVTWQQIQKTCEKCKLNASTCSATLDKDMLPAIAHKPISLPYLSTSTERVIYSKGNDLPGATILCDYTASVLRNRLHRSEAICISPTPTK